VQAKHRTHLFGAAQFEVAQPTPLFDPAKHLLNAAAGVHRLGLTLVTGGSDIDGGGTRKAGVLRHVRCQANPPEFGNHSLGDVVLVGPQGFLVGTGDGGRHRLGGHPALQCMWGLGDAAVHNQGVAVVR